MDVLRRNSDKLFGLRLYFIRLDSNGTPLRVGEPYCTICSKMVLDVGISEFVLWHEKGVCVYGIKECSSFYLQFEKDGEGIQLSLQLLDL